MLGELGGLEEGVFDVLFVAILDKLHDVNEVVHARFAKRSEAFEILYVHIRGVVQQRQDSIFVAVLACDVQWCVAVCVARVDVGGIILK